MIMSAIQNGIARIDSVSGAQKLLFDDLGELTPIPRRRKKPPLSREQREKRRRLRERYFARQCFLFGPRVKRKKKSRAIFALFPDVDDFPLATFFVNHLDDAAVQNAVDMEVSTIPQETIELGQLITKERAAMVRETWSENKKRKRNCFFVKPLDWRNSSIDDSATGQDGHLSGE